MNNQLTFTELNHNTKQAKHFTNAYYNSKNETIFEAYKRPSNKKIRSYQKIKEEMESVGGTGLRITGAGSDFFSCAYTLNIDGQVYLIYHTHANRYKILYF